MKYSSGYSEEIKHSLNIHVFRKIIKYRENYCVCAQYKYQVNVDGTVAAYRFPYLMLGNSVVMKQDSSYYEHFYTHLRPGRHYLQLKRDLSDLIEKIQWAKVRDY